MLMFEEILASHWLICKSNRSKQNTLNETILINYILRSTTFRTAWGANLQYFSNFLCSVARLQGLKPLNFVQLF